MLAARFVLCASIALCAMAPGARAFQEDEEATQPARWSGPVLPATVPVASALRISRLAKAPPLNELVKRIAESGPTTIDTTLDILVLGRVPETCAEDAPQKLSKPQTALLLSALRTFPEAKVRAELASRLEHVAEETRIGLATVQVLGAIGKIDDFERMAALAPRRQKDPEALRRDSAEALRAAFTAILQRNGYTSKSIVELVPKLDRACVRELLAALGTKNDTRALAVLSQTARSHPGLASHAVSLVQKCGRSFDPAVDAEFCTWMRSQLLGARPEYARLLLQAIGELDEGESVPALIAELSNESSSVRASALWGLRRISGLALPPEVEAWTAWYDEEVRWNDRERQRFKDQLVLRDDMEKTVAALSAYAGRRIRRTELALDVAEVLRSKNRQLRELACKTLGQLDSYAVVPLLAAIVEEGDGTIAASALLALRTITKLELPNDVEGMRKALTL
jgi:hypothetical protein